MLLAQPLRHHKFNLSRRSTTLPPRRLDWSAGHISALSIPMCRGRLTAFLRHPKWWGPKAPSDLQESSDQGHQAVRLMARTVQAVGGFLPLVERLSAGGH